MDMMKKTNKKMKNYIKHFENEFITEEDGGGAAGSGDASGGMAYANNGNVDGMGAITNATVSDIPGDPDGSIAGSGDVSVPFGVYQKANAGKGGTRFGKIAKKILKDPMNIQRSQQINHIKDHLGVGKVLSFSEFANESNGFMSQFKTFKLRAETPIDVATFINLAAEHLLNYKMDFDPVLISAEFEFTTKLPLKNILKILRQVPDGHVMVQTVQILEDYTGERDDDRF